MIFSRFLDIKQWNIYNCQFYREKVFHNLWKTPKINPDNQPSAILLLASQPDLDAKLHFSPLP